MKVMEVVLEDQILHADPTEEVTSDENPFKKLLKKEQRLIARLHEEQEAEALAHERFQRAQARLKRSEKRLERIQGKLVHVREQLAELQITDQQTIDGEKELVIVPTPDPTTSIPSEEVTLVQVEQANVVAQESDDLTSAHAESSIPGTSIPEHEATAIHTDVSDVSVVEGNEEMENEQEYPIPQQETTSPEPVEVIVDSEPGTTLDTLAVESEPEISDGVDIPSETNLERKPTKPLRLEQPDLPVAESHSPDIQSAKEAWIAAESAMQNARNAAHGLAASISFLSQTDGLRDEFMEELVRKQADANKELLNAQDAARAAYERFVQAQKDTQSAANRLVEISTNTSEDHSQQKQENASLPPAEENGVDQTAKLHAVRLYSEW
jgi:hypothetical protein